jgi:acyl-CoA dehydrogenase
MHWAIWDCMFIQQAFEGVIANFPNKLFAFVLRRVVVFPLGRPYVVPSDKLGHRSPRCCSNPRRRATA